MTLHVSRTPEVTGARRVVRGFALALAAALVAGAVSTALPAAAATTGITISGHVTAAATGKAVEGIDVTLYSEFDPADEEGTYGIDYKSTSATGGYSFKNVKPGKYRVAFETYYGDENVLSQFFNGEPGDLTGDVESITVSASTTIDQALEPGGQVTGRVLDAKGKPVYAGITIVPTDEGINSEKLSFAETDKNGRFTALGLLSDDYTFYVSGISKANLANTAFEVDNVTQGETVAAGDLTLDAGSTILGTARKANGSVVKNSVLMAFRIDEDGTTNGVPYSYAGVNSRGEYQMPNLPTGNFVIANLDIIALLMGSGGSYAGGDDSPLTAIQVAVGAGGSKVYRDIRFEKLAQITGKLTDAEGKAAPKVQVIAVQNDFSPLYNFALGLDSITDEGFTTPVTVLAETLKKQADARPKALTKKLVDAGLPASTPISTAETSSNGSYTLPDVTIGGSYTLYFNGSTSPGASLDGTTAKATSYVTGTTTVANAKLSRSVSVKGTVTSASGTPQKNVYVEGLRASASVAGFDREAASPEDVFYTPHLARTDSKGRYTLRLPADQWVLYFSDALQKLSPRYLGGGTYPTDSATTVLDTTASSYAGQNIVLGTSGATITGSVVTSTGSDAAEGDVLLDRVVDGSVVDTIPVYNPAADWFYLGDQFPLRRVVDGDYNLRFITATYSANYVFPVTTTTFTVAGGVVTSVNGEAPAARNSLGKIVLEAPEKISPLSDAELTVTADGPLVVGTTLHADLGSAEETSDDVFVQWFRDGIAIGSAFGRDYVIQPGDIGAHITFQASGLETFLTSPAPQTSAPTGVVQDGEFPLDPGSPTINGSGSVGSVLTAVPAGDQATEHKYKWRINGVDYLGATKPTFTPRIADLGDTISVAVAPKSGEGAGVYVVSNRVVVSDAAPVVTPTTTASVLVGGKAMNTSRLGAVLTTKTNLPKDSLVLSYQWEYATTGTNWKPLAGKDRPTLTLSKKTTSTSKIGYSYRVVVTAERSGTEAGPVVTSKAVKVTKAYKK